MGRQSLKNLFTAPELTKLMRAICAAMAAIAADVESSFDQRHRMTKACWVEVTLDADRPWTFGLEYAAGVVRDPSMRKITLDANRELYERFKSLSLSQQTLLAHHALHSSPQDREAFMRRMAKPAPIG